MSLLVASSCPAVRRLRRALLPAVLLLATGGGLLAQAVAPADEFSTASAPFPNFESGPTEGMLLSPDGAWLYVLNTPDHRVEVFATFPQESLPVRRLSDLTGGGLTGGGQVNGPEYGMGVPPGAGGVSGVVPRPLPRLTHVASIFTGLEPVAMALHPDDPQVMFVSNFVSDSVSVVDLARSYVVATIPVGDEPQGLVVSGGKLFVTAARAPQTPLVPGQVDPGPHDEHLLVVVDAFPPYAVLDNVELGSVKPRDVVALGGGVHVIAQASGNHTTILDEKQVDLLGMVQDEPDVTELPFAVNPTLQRAEFVFPQYVRGWIIPKTGRIVHDHEYPGIVNQLDDRDIVSVDVTTHAVAGTWTSDVGSVLLDLERNPISGQLWVVGTEARNRVRFEPELSGNAVENRVVVADAGGDVTDVLLLAPPFTSVEHAQPVSLVFASGPHGDNAYVAALGTDSIVAIDAQTKALVDEIPTGSMPSGLAVDGARGWLYVFCRGDKSLRVYDVAGAHAPAGEVAYLPYDPEPRSVREGRRLLYGALPSEGLGNRNMSCASCHVFGHYDHLAWDLGNPEGSLGYHYPDVMTDVAGFPGSIVVAHSTPILNPLKGPMVTQSFRGLMDPDTKDDLPLHWRGDRRTIHSFQTAWKGLLGGAGISRRQMQEFAAFIRSIRYPPNPIEPKDREYTGLAAQGLQVFGLDPELPGTEYSAPGTGVLCASCHQANFVDEADFTGARPTVSAGSFTQLFNTAQLRQTYEKDFIALTGFGALHDGAVDGVRGFMDFTVPLNGNPTFPGLSVIQKDAISALVHAWDTGMAPLVGAQFTLDVDSAPQLDAFLDLVEVQARPPFSDLDLVLKGFRELPDGTLLPRGALYRLDPGTSVWGYQWDTGDVTDRSVLHFLAEQDLGSWTFTCVPPGMGERLGIDRDEDGLWDFLELAAGTDPARADSDGDGYADGREIEAGTEPLVVDRSVPDGDAPVISSASALEVFNTTATISFRTDEPVGVLVETGTAVGSYGLGSFAADGRRRIHDVFVDGLPAGSEVFYRVTATDTNGNAGLFEGSFTTLPPYYHVEDITLVVNGSGPYTATATVLVHDQDGLPVIDVPVHVFWAGDIGGQAWEDEQRTDGSGVATFGLLAFTPAGPTTVSFSPAYVGTGFPSDPFFVGVGGDTPSFFYDTTENEAAYRAVDLP